MSGIRLHHATARNSILLVEDLGRLHPKAYHCSTCKRKHYSKTYHLRIDSEGDVIVSEVVLEGLRRAGLGGFLVLNEVKDPPAQVIGRPREPLPIVR